VTINYCWGPAVFPTNEIPLQFYDPAEAWIYDYFAAPVPLSTSVALGRLSVSHASACGLTASGAAWCWGDNWSGELGNGTTTSSFYSAVPVAGGLDFASIDAGGFVSCGVTVAGVAYCWGNNESGGLGNGTTISSNVPVKVAGQP
jgi:alpha-tubulin suppressor-like RCC1 family protein